jgi:hypothetical protein
VPPIGPYVIPASLDTYGATVTQIKAPIGATVPLVDIEKALKEKKYKILTFTHVDTSTGIFLPDPCEYLKLTRLATILGVLSNAQAIAELTKRVSPDTLVSFFSSADQCSDFEYAKGHHGCCVFCCI